MRFSFVLDNLKPFSVNDMYYKDGRQKTQKYYDWSFSLFSRLQHENIQAGLDPFRTTFDPAKHGFVLRLTAYYPKAYFFNRQGHISARTMDLSNWEKPLIDCLFLPKHHKNEPPYGSPNMNADDRYIMSVSSNKRWADTEHPYLRISIQMINVPGQNPRPE